MKGTISDFTIDEDGNAIIGEKDEGDVEGTAENAEIAVELTKNIEDIKNGLKNMNSTKIKYRVNLQAAIKLANKSFSNNVNKLLISLYDGVPNIAIGVASQVSYGGIFSEYLTMEEAIIAKHKNISNKTKSEILNLMKSNVNFILLRPDDTSYDQKWYNTTTGEFKLEFDGSPYVKEIYGTLENPTYGKMYSLNNDNLERIVTEYIYQDIIEEIGTDIKSAVIKEYFSDKILNNFDITFNNGNIDTTNLLTDKFITWNIGDLATNKTANLKYTLKIKDMKNSDLLNKVLSTSEKTNFSYINKLNQETEKEATDSPKIQLLEIKEELIATVTYDPTYTTTGTVIATINTNKKVNKVEGWTLSENGQTLTKQYSKNTTEIVHLVDIDNMTKDVEVKITNIQVNNNDNNYNNNDNVKDDTTALGKLPQAGISIGIIIVIVLIALCGIYTYLKQHNLRDI